MSLPESVEPGADGAIAAAVGADPRRTLLRSVDHVVREWRAVLAQVERQQAGNVPSGERDDLAGLREFTRSAIDAFERIGREGAGRIDHLAPSELSWHEISAEWAKDEAAGRALWEAVKRSAAEQLAAGYAGARAVEGSHGRPMERAEYLAVWRALADGLRPQNGMERLLIDGMAEAWIVARRWLRRHAETMEADAVRVERDLRRRGEWEPPRLGEAAAVDRAALLADRFQREFLRLLKAFRDQWRLFGTLVVAGGQVNIGERQVVATRTVRAAQARGGRRIRRRVRPTDVPGDRGAAGQSRAR